jgi:hypothetical protein
MFARLSVGTRAFTSQNTRFSSRYLDTLVFQADVVAIEL